MKNIFALLIILLSIQAVAQEVPPSYYANTQTAKTVDSKSTKMPGLLTEATTDTTRKKSPPKYIHPISLQVTAGTQGVGLDVHYGVIPKLSVRAGASLVPIKANDVFSFSGFASQNDLNAKFANAHLLLDYVPFDRAKWFRVVGGAGYFFRGDVTLLVTPTGTYKYGDIPLTDAEVGVVSTDIDWKGAAPYLGIGLFKAFPSKMFNFNLDLGTYYLVQPKVTVVGTGLLTGNSSQQPVIANNLKDYRFLPVLQLNFNFKL